MYHAARALVLHIRRADLDDHERLPAALGQCLGLPYGDLLGRGREARNQVDYFALSAGRSTATGAGSGERCRIAGGGVSRGSAEAGGEPMKLRELTVPYVVQEVDYGELRRALEHAFVDEYGLAAVQDVRVVHFNPDVIDATVVVQARQPAMDDLALHLSELFRRDDLRVAIRVAEARQPALPSASG